MKKNKQNYLTEDEMLEVSMSAVLSEEILKLLNEKNSEIAKRALLLALENFN